MILFSITSYAQQPEESEIISTSNASGEWKVLTFGPYQYYSPDGNTVYVCLKRFAIDMQASQDKMCVDDSGQVRWVNARNIAIKGYTFSKFELLYSGNGFDKKGNTIVKVNLIMHFKKNIYI